MGIQVRNAGWTGLNAGVPRVDLRELFRAARRFQLISSSDHGPPRQNGKSRIKRAAIILLDESCARIVQKIML